LKKYCSQFVLRPAVWIFLGLLAASAPIHARAQTPVNVRVMAANLNGDAQTYQPFAIRIFQGLKPDVVAIQEFKYNNNTDSDLRSLVDTAFGTNFSYYREPFTAAGDLPNGVISRYPIVASGSWTDNSVANRGFAWAQIDLPGTNDLYVVSVHLLTSSSTDRATEAAQLKGLMQSNFPTNAWIVLAGDFNTGSRTEATITTFNGYLSDVPVPVDNNGVSFTNGKRNAPHDYVLPSLSLTNMETASVFPSHSFPNGLVFDSQVYTPLTDVAPVQFLDTTNAQHMAVIKDFLIIDTGSSTNPPGIATQPADRTVPAGSNVLFSVTATGASPLSYQWYFNTHTLITNATASTLTVTNAQLADAGAYSVIITNVAGSITSSVATLTVTNSSPIITPQPQSQAVSLGASATFLVAATGTAPLSYQWFFNTNAAIPGAISNSLTIANAQLTNAGAYSVVVSNSVGSATSAVAILTVISTAPEVIAQWNFNSTSPDGATGTGTILPSLGSGVASLVGGATATFATGDTSLDPAGSTDNSAWNTSTYPAQGTGNKTRGVQFAVSTAGRQNIVISWTSQASNTGTKYAHLQFTTNGTDFIDFPTAVTNATTFSVKTNSLAAFSGVNNNPNFAFRILAEFESSAINTANTNYVAANATSTYGSPGTLRYDMVTISGSPLVSAPPAPPILTSPSITSSNQFQFTVTGTAGSNYIVQVSTNLSETNWISLFTNTAPFTFTDSNATAFPQGFYRAVLSP
jgi:endonuclease/exonuclease/phosphatase family metal-dependent hydrolase